MIAVGSYNREQIGSKPFNHELTINHEFRQPETEAREANITNMLQYIQLYVNPFRVAATTGIKLHNIINQEVINEEVGENVLNVEAKGLLQYTEFRRDYFLNKSKKLTDTIHRNNLKTFNSVSSDKTAAKTSKKKL